jgi:hypothetical protein
MIRLLLGIQPTTPGWRTFEFVPQPASLSTINATVPAGSGNVIVVTIRQTAGSFATTLDVPIGSKSELVFEHVSLTLGTHVQPSEPSCSPLKPKFTLDNRSSLSKRQGCLRNTKSSPIVVSLAGPAFCFFTNF